MPLVFTFAHFGRSRIGDATSIPQVPVFTFVHAFGRARIDDVTSIYLCLTHLYSQNKKAMQYAPCPQSPACPPNPRIYIQACIKMLLLPVPPPVNVTASKNDNSNILVCSIKILLKFTYCIPASFH
jgi:hypothetical protein